MGYQIITAALGMDEDGVVKTDRDSFSSSQLALNLALHWAWNIRGQFGYEADGPCVFIEWGVSE